MVRWELSLKRIILRAAAFSVLIGLMGSWSHMYRIGAKTIVGRVAGFDTGSPAKKNTVELPRVYIDTTLPAPKGDTLVVPAGGNLQEAINSAKCGDVVRLVSGASFVGNFVLANKGDCKAWIIIQSDAADSNLPAPGSRIGPSYANAMPQLFSNNVGPAITTANGANHYRLVGVE